MVDGTGLENQQVNSLASSNLVPSAKYKKNPFGLFLYLSQEDKIRTESSVAVGDETKEKVSLFLLRDDTRRNDFAFAKS